MNTTKRKQPVPEVSVDDVRRLVDRHGPGHVAERCGVDVTTVARWTAGVSVPFQGSRRQISKMLRRLSTARA